MHLHSLLRGAHAYLSPSAALAGLSSSHAAHRGTPDGHSIAEIVAHMAFWQEWFLDRCEGRHTLAPARAELGWPAVNGMSWDAVYDRFATGFNRALKLADDDARTAQPIAPPLEFGPIANYTVGDALMHISLHNAHHLGQVITLRQMLGAWPPPAGGFTW